MKENRIEEKIRQTFDGLAPDNGKAILEKCAEVPQVRAGGRRKKSYVRLIAVAVAVMLLVGAVIGIGIYSRRDAAGSENGDAEIILDVNPSVKISLDKEKTVKSVLALNRDAEEILKDTNLTGKTMNEAVDILVGKMIAAGYISERANSILVSVDGDSAAKKEIKDAVVQQISSSLEAKEVKGAILSQVVSEGSQKEYKALAEKYDISTGKAKLIAQITAQNSFVTFEQLVGLTINELNLISESGKLTLENIESVGEASDLNYIGYEKAEQIAIADAALGSETVRKFKSSMEWEDGRMVYEVEFKTADKEYEYDIDALTGKILEKEIDDEDDDDDKPGEGKNVPSSSTGKNANYIGEAAAKEIATSSAALDPTAKLRDYECELGHKHGKVVYEVEFEVGDCEYEYLIDAETGAVLKCEKEQKKAKK